MRSSADLLLSCSSRATSKKKKKHTKWPPEVTRLVCRCRREREGGHCRMLEKNRMRSGHSYRLYLHALLTNHAPVVDIPCDCFEPRACRTLRYTCNTVGFYLSLDVTFFFFFCVSQAQRLVFDQSSPNGILLFRECSKVAVAFGTRLLQVQQSLKVDGVCCSGGLGCGAGLIGFARVVVVSFPAASLSGPNFSAGAHLRYV